MKNKQQSHFVHIGSSSLLVVFLTLCLSTFAVLSLSSAKSDYTFSERLAEHKTSYYEALTKAEIIVSKIDTLLYETAKANDSDASLLFSDGDDGLDVFDNYIFSVSSALNGKEIDGAVIICEPEGEDFLLSFQIPVNDKLALQAVLQVTDYKTHDNYYEIKTWKTVYTDS